MAPQVVILCGGMGARLREETEFRPKPMVTIGDRPILWHIMKIYAHQGFRDFVLCLGYKGEMIKEYFYHYEVFNNDFTVELGSPRRVEVHNIHPENGWKVTLADTGACALKGARIKRAAPYIQGDEFLLAYGDCLADIDLAALVAFHRRHGRAATVTGVNPASRFGELRVRGDVVESFTEKPQDVPGLINGGFMVLSRRVLDALTDDDACDFEYGPLEGLAAQGQLMVYRHPGFWACMDTLRDMEALNRLWSDGHPPWKVWT
ncbi:MAG: glucose-1-phosphate cytidylyltransferase [Planctomycetota bacterium]